MRSALRTLLAVLAVSKSVYADACSGCTSDCNVKASGDETPIGSCTTFKGSINVSGPGVTSLDLGSIREIKGDLIVNNCTNLGSISASQLTTIDGKFELFAVTRLSSLSMAFLGSCGSILFQTCPALTALNTAITQCPDVIITDTNLGSLSGLALKTGGTLDINNNNYLGEVTMPGLKTLDTALNIEFNGKSTGKKLAASFPNLIWAVNATFRDVNAINLPALVAINGSMGFYNDSLTSISCPNLTAIGESLSIDDCSQITNVSFPALTTIGGTFQIANNSALQVIDGFPKVDTVKGAVDWSGIFTNATLPSLKDVEGGFNLQTSAAFDCTEFQNDQNNGVIRGEGFTCSGKVANPGTKGSPTTTGSGTGSTPTKKAAGSRTQLSLGLVVVASVAGLFISL